MGLHGYIEKLRNKPVREREKIAIIATAVGFAFILIIWIISFNEMNKAAQPQADETSASLNDLKTNFQTGKDSIQNMMNQLPSQAETTGVDTTSGTNNLGTGSSAAEVPSAPGVDSNQNIGNNPSTGSDSGANPNSNPTINGGNPDQKNNSVPQLP